MIHFNLILEKKERCPTDRTSSSEEEQEIISISSEQSTSNLRQLEFEISSNSDQTSKLENIPDDGLHSSNNSPNSDSRSQNSDLLTKDLREWALETNVNHVQLRKLFLKLSCQRIPEPYCAQNETLI